MYKSADEVPVVLKIIPIEGDLIVNGGPQKRFSEILSEIVIAEELSALSNGKENKTDGFVKIKSVRCIKGAYPQHLLDAWEIFNDSCLKGSENDNPDIFDEDQLYIVFEQYNAGLDLEAFIFKNAEEAFSIFVQVSTIFRHLLFFVPLSVILFFLLLKIEQKTRIYIAENSAQLFLFCVKS